MRKHSLVAGIAAITLLPTIAFAQQQTCEQQRADRTKGTVVGAIIGGIAGSAVAGHGDRATGAVIGGVGGAIVGNQLSKPKTDCRPAYGYYDNDGRWHAYAVTDTSAQGYYDRSGNWVDGTPNGSYDSSGRWVASNAGYRDSRGYWVPGQVDGYYDTNGTWVTATRTTVSNTSRDDSFGYYDRDGKWNARDLGGRTGAGYYDRNNVWVSGAPNGYYDRGGMWVAGSANGHYDINGRWVNGGGPGYYDSRGRWMSGQGPGHRDATGAWVADAQPGYYDSNGRWRAGPVVGYYDSNGRWIGGASNAGAYGSNASSNMGPEWGGGPTDIRSRETWLEERIRRSAADGRLTNMQARDALGTLSDIRNHDRRLSRRHGGLNSHDQEVIGGRLDSLQDTVRNNVRNNRN